MALSFSVAAILEKNKLSSTGVWLILLEMALSDGSYVRIAKNNEDITWNGYTWQRFPFKLDDLIEEGQGEQAVLRVLISNTTRVLVPYMEADKGMVGRTVSLYVVLSNNLSNTTPEIDEEFRIVKSGFNDVWATFELGAPSYFARQFPHDRFLKNWCRFKFNYPHGDSPRCGWTGTGYTECGGTLSDCRERGNSERFGGFLGIPEGGMHATT